MRRYVVTLLMMAVVLAGPTVTLAAPPQRPLPLTAEQYAAVVQLEQQAPHQVVLDVQATYTSEHAQQMEANLLADDITTAMTQAGWPAALAIILLLAAPL